MINDVTKAAIVKAVAISCIAIAACAALVAAVALHLIFSPGLVILGLAAGTTAWLIVAGSGVACVSFLAAGIALFVQSRRWYQQTPAMPPLSPARVANIPAPPTISKPPETFSTPQTADTRDYYTGAHDLDRVQQQEAANQKGESLLKKSKNQEECWLLLESCREQLTEQTHKELHLILPHAVTEKDISKNQFVLRLKQAVREIYQIFGDHLLLGLFSKGFLPKEEIENLKKALTLITHDFSSIDTFFNTALSVAYIETLKADEGKGTEEGYLNSWRVKLAEWRSRAPTFNVISTPTCQLVSSTSTTQRADNAELKETTSTAHTPVLSTTMARPTIGGDLQITEKHAVLRSMNRSFQPVFEEKLQNFLLCFFEKDKIGPTRVKNIANLLFGGFTYERAHYPFQLHFYGHEKKTKLQENEEVEPEMVPINPVPIAKGLVKKIYGGLKDALTGSQESFPSKIRTVQRVVTFLQESLKSDKDLQKAIMDWGAFLKNLPLPTWGNLSFNGITSGFAFLCAKKLIQFYLPDENECQPRWKEGQQQKILGVIVADHAGLGAYVDDLFMDLTKRLVAFYNKKTVTALIDDIYDLFVAFEELQTTGGLFSKKAEFNLEKINSFCEKLQKILLFFVGTLDNSSDKKLVQSIEYLFDILSEFIDPIIEAAIEAEERSDTNLGAIAWPSPNMTEEAHTEFWDPICKMVPDHFWAMVKRLPTHFGLQLSIPDSWLGPDDLEKSSKEPN